MKPVSTVLIQRLLFITLLISGTVAAATGPVNTGVVPETGLRFWEWNARGVLFRLTQRLPDQTRAYFMARGFDNENAESIATRCVFQSMFKNIAEQGEGAVSIDLDTWRIHSAGGETRMITREKWPENFVNPEVAKAAAIALEWSLLPTRQVYAPGDYNWGMTGYGLKPGKVFDLDFSWKRGDKVFQGYLKSVECAPDIHPDPQL